MTTAIPVNRKDFSITPLFDGGVLYSQENGIKVKVDDDILIWLTRVWLMPMKLGRYVGFKRKNTIRYLHREIMDCPEYSVVDHINGDPMDNRRKNLRICSNSDNVRNRVVLNKNNHSGKRGVMYDKSRDCWMSVIKHNRKTIFLGRFADFEAACQSRREAELAYWGNFRGIV